MVLGIVMLLIGAFIGFVLACLLQVGRYQEMYGEYHAMEIAYGEICKRYEELSESQGN